MSELTTTHERFVRQLLLQRYIRSEAVERAFRHIGREDFLPASLRSQAYRDAAIAVKWDRHGSCISSCSQPSLTAMMLEMLDLHPGLQVLDIGTGTGYTAALLCTMVGDQAVTSMDIDADLVESARRRLADYHFHPRLFAADALSPWPVEGRFDRVLISAGVPYIPEHWLNHLNPGAVLVLPFCWGGVDYLTRLTFTDSGILQGRISIFTMFTGLRHADASGQTLSQDNMNFHNPLPSPLQMKRMRLSESFPFSKTGSIEGFHIYTLATEPFPCGGLWLTTTEHHPAGYHGQALYAEDSTVQAYIFLPLFDPENIWTSGPAESLIRQLMTALQGWKDQGCPLAHDYLLRFVFTPENGFSDFSKGWWASNGKNTIHVTIQPQKDEAFLWS